MIASHIYNRRSGIARLIVLLAIAPWLTPWAGAQEGDQSPPRGFQDLLSDAGVTPDELSAFDGWQGGLTEEQASLASRLLFRLERAARSGRFHPPHATVDQGELSELKRGEVVRVAGRGVAFAPIELPPASQAALDQAQLFHSRVELAGGVGVDVISPDVPAAWRKRSPRLLDEPVDFDGVLVGTAGSAGAARPLLFANRLRWRPASNVSVGVAWLVDHGFDAALLDEIRHGQPFAKPHESLESLAFYQCLTVMARSNPAELLRLAHAALSSKADQAKATIADAAAKRQSLVEAWDDASLARRRELRQELKQVRRRQAVASKVVERAGRGVSSVAPLFLQPAQHTGELVLIEGTARRAIRIVVDGAADRARQSLHAVGSPEVETPLLTEYYELDVFTTDSQNLPIICCVARLPERFPTGEAIREPVRVAGVFFKQWAYVRRADDVVATSENRPPERLHPPLVVAAMPEWLQTAAPATSQSRGLWAGLALLTVFGVVWIVLMRVARRDRLARARRARYDSPLEIGES